MCAFGLSSPDYLIKRHKFANPLRGTGRGKWGHNCICESEMHGGGLEIEVSNVHLTSPWKHYSVTKCQGAMMR